MNKKLRLALLLLMVAVFVGSGLLILRQLANYRAAEEAEALARALAEQSAMQTEAPAPVKLSEPESELEPEIPLSEGPIAPPESQAPLDEEAHFLAELDLNTLEAINADVLGWISIPGTQLDYPLVQGEDNSYYLNVTWNGVVSSAGSIFLERRTNPDLSDYNSIIYGHNMRSGSMFAALHLYKDQGFYEEHPHVYIRSGNCIRRYEIYSAYEADVTGDTYRLLFADEAEKQRFLDLGMERSVIESDLVPDTEDHILTLSTCTGTGYYETRWVVQAVLTGIFHMNEKHSGQTSMIPQQN